MSPKRVVGCRGGGPYVERVLGFLVSGFWFLSLLVSWFLGLLVSWFLGFRFLGFLVSKLYGSY